MSEGLHIIISGGSKGLGAALAEHLLAQGHRVATFSRTRTPAVEALAAGPHAERFLWQPLDVTDAAAVRRYVLDRAREQGRLDALVNNVAVAVEGPFALTRPDEVRQALGVNLEAAIVLAQACARRMMAQGRGAIVNVSSIVGSRGYAGLAVYSATKAGLEGMSRALARELGPRGVRVNAIAPGYFETELSASLSERQRNRIARRTPLGRLGRAEDIVGAVEFLLSPASAFITGQTLTIDGGLTC